MFIYNKLFVIIVVNGLFMAISFNESTLSSLDSLYRVISKSVQDETLWPAIPQLKASFEQTLKTIYLHYGDLNENQQTQVTAISKQFHQCIVDWNEKQRTPKQTWGNYFGSFIWAPAPPVAKPFSPETASFLLGSLALSVEKHLDTVGLYRISGSKALIEKVTQNLKQNRHSMIPAELDADIHNVSSLIKAIFREMETPLLETIRENLLVLNTKEASLATYQSVIDRLPLINKQLLLRLFRHLNNVSKSSETNQMTAQNLAICFTPNLFDQTNLAKAMVETIQRNAVVTFLIEHATELV
jgi:hypothetical protein